MLQKTRVGFLTAGAVVMLAGVAYAAEWNGENPWWCYAPANACSKWASASHYVGPTYNDCVDVGNGWRDENYVETRCNN